MKYFVTTKTRTGEHEYYGYYAIDVAVAYDDALELVAHYLAIYEDDDQIESLRGMLPMTDSEYKTVAKFVGFALTEKDMREAIEANDADTPTESSTDDI